MTAALNAHLLDAMRLTQTGRLSEATAAIQAMLQGKQSIPTPGDDGPGSRRGDAQITIEGIAEPPGQPSWRATKAAARPTPDIIDPRKGAAGGTGWATLDWVPGFPEVSLNFDWPNLRKSAAALPGPRVATPAGAAFLTGTFGDDARIRPYKLYIPSGYDANHPAPLIVMLHGCKQSPDDFAAGTRMNEAAETRTCLVVYPGQSAAANTQRCWNWFNESDQRRGYGEPALIADLVHKIAQEYAVDRQRIYVAGLSAGGATAAIMGSAYPDLFAAIGVHSGLACGAARDMPSAFAAMQGNGARRPDPISTAQAAGRIVPAIVFHGDRDHTVNSRNADAVVAQSVQSTAPNQRVDRGCSPGGLNYSCTVSMDDTGRAIVEQWVLHGAGHAWAGGDSAGSFTDPRGPDATREMLRFFLDHPHDA